MALRCELADELLSNKSCTANHYDFHGLPFISSPRRQTRCPGFSGVVEKCLLAASARTRPGYSLGLMPDVLVFDTERQETSQVQSHRSIHYSIVLSNKDRRLSCFVTWLVEKG